MRQPAAGLETADWEITAISLRCDCIGQFVTVMVNRDRPARCSWYLKFKSKTAKGKKPKISKPVKEKMEKCTGPDCPAVIRYREKLVEEELRKA